MEVRRGDVFLVDLNPVIGTEQVGIRPALVIQVDRANAASPHTIIIPFSTRIRKVMLPSHVRVPAGVGGLSEESILLCEQIRVVDKRRLVHRLGNVGEQYLGEVEKSYQGDLRSALNQQTNETVNQRITNE